MIAMPAGMANPSIATSNAVTSPANAAHWARTLNPPSSTSTTASGSSETSADRPSDPPIASGCCWYAASDIPDMPGSVRAVTRSGKRWSGPGYRYPADARVEQLHRVQQRHVDAEVLADLQQAARVGGDDDVRPGRRDVLGLPRAELARGLGRDHVVDARRTAAQLRFGQVEELDTRDGAQHGAGLRPHLLRVPEVAGVVVGDAGAYRVAGGAGLALGQHLVHVAHPRAERLGALGPLRVVVEQVAVLLHRRAAARHVGDDVVHVQVGVDADLAPGPGQRGFFAAGVE